MTNRFNDSSRAPIMEACLLALLALVLGFCIRAAHAAPCSVGYSPAQFAGKPDPWPGDVPLPNDQLRAAYFDRYGQDPGAGGTRIGYCCELFGLNYEALENAAKNGGTGPNGEPLHPGCASTTEATDLSFAVPRGAPYFAQWVAAYRDGGTPATAIHVHQGDILGAVPCGPFSVPKAMFGAFPIYYVGEQPCGGSPPPPPPVCGNGILETGETCATCPPDQPPHACDPPPPPPPADHCSAPGAVCMVPPAPCPALAAIPQPARTACKALLGAKNVNGQPIPARWRQWLSDACEWLPRAESYKPGVQSTAQTRLVLLSQRCAP